jgi:hypothetical protein
MKARTISAVLAGLVLFAIGPAPAANAARAPNTFEGTCTLSGELVFDPPLSNELQTVRFTDTASGTCDGTLNGVPGTDIPVVNRVSGSGTLSCAAGETTSDDTLTFAHRYPLRIFTRAVGGLTQFTAYSRGAVSGESVEELDFGRYFDPATPAACEAGTVSSARYDLIAHTITPLVG